MRFRTIPALVCFTVSAFVGRAEAQVACDVPSYEQCTSDSRNPADSNQSFWSSSCGEQEQAAWQEGGGACSAYVSEELTDAVPGSPRIVYLPAEARYNGLSIATSQSVPYSYKSHYALGLLGSYANLQQRSAIDVLVNGLDVESLPERRAWGGNGLRVDSCEEYAYEKYYDYSHFEDTVAVAAGDARAVFDAAYEPGAIGDRALHGQDPASKSRGTTHELSWFGTYPKNVYFEYQQRQPMMYEGAAFEMDPDFKARIDSAQRVQHDLQWHWDMSQALASQPDDLLYAMAEKQAVFAKLLALRARIYGKWANAMGNWLDSVGSCFVEIPPGAMLPNFDAYINPAWSSLVNVYDHGDPITDRTPVALTDAQAVQVELGLSAPAAPAAEDPGAAAGLGLSDATQAATLDHSSFGQYARPRDSVTQTTQSAALPTKSLGGRSVSLSVSGRSLGAASVVRGAGVSQATIRSAAPNVSPSASESLAADSVVAQPAYSDEIDVGKLIGGDGDCAKLPDLVFSCSTSFATGLALVMDYAERVSKCLPAVDAKIAEALAEARADGCLEPDSVTPCDWSPQVFVNELRSKSVDQREQDFNTCQRFTGNDFGPTSLIKTAQPVSGEADMARSTEHVDRFFKDLRALAAQAKFPTDPATGRPIFGAKTADSGRLGNGDFGVGYSYDVGWKLSNLDDNTVRICASDFDMNVDLDIDATVFGHTETLVQSQSYLRTDDVPNGKTVSPHASLVVLGQQILKRQAPAPVTVPSGGAQVSFPGLHERLVKRRTLLEAKAHFAIGPFPVTISAGAAGEVGVELSLDGEMQYSCLRPKENPSGMQANNSAVPDALALAARGGARPYAGLSAFATAAVDAVVASAGVRADLTLLNLSVPFTAGVSADIRPGSVPHVHADTDLRLVLETLSGRISVFIDTLFGKVLDQTIFRWDGPRVEKPIVDESWDMDMRLARIAVIY